MGNGRVFARTLLVTICCLVVIFTVGYRVSAEGIEETGQEQGSLQSDVSQEEPTAPESIPEESPAESIPEESQSESSSTPVEENPGDPGIDTPDNLPMEPEAPVSESWQDALICLHYDFHVFLYGLIPLSTAIFIVVLGCWWFYCTFVRSAL